MNLSPEIYPTVIKMFFILTAFLALMGSLIYLSKKMSKKQMRDNNSDLIKILDNKYIGIKKNISLIYIPKKIILLGITNDKINCLSEIKDKNIVEEILSKTESKSYSFYKHLQKWSTKLKEKN
jgi:flagellar biogenesis protein FliO